MTSIEICRLWAQAIKNDAELDAQIRAHTGVGLKVIIGYDMVTELDEADCPYVVLQPLSDNRGPDATENEFQIALFLGAVIPGGPEPGPEGVLELPCLTFMDTVFCPLVLGSLDPTEPYPGLAECELQMPRSGYVEKYLRLTCKTQNYIGIGADVWR
ncbi:MAG: hypothetical protein SOZ39_01365 [Desulfovibrio piger]|uniref:hypothetical protein n=1 Tax=Desulfovibrio piger TaxID=901 RepID=UPI002A7EA6E7|nr:hypothetical protein [Desulfovibrio piger]MDY3879775.1 hypothetical protein [Desulfovibrio piger]